MCFLAICMSSQGYGFSCGHVWIWELECEEGWVPKNWCFWSVVLEKTLETPLDCKEVQPVYFEDQPWDFFGRNDAKAETPIFWPPHEKSWLMEKTLMLGGVGGRRRSGRQRMKCLDGITDSMDVSLSDSHDSRDSGSWWWTGRPGVLRLMGSQRVGHHWATELNWCHSLSMLSSAAPFSFGFQSSPASGSFPMNQLYVRWPKYWIFSFSICPSIE